MCTVTYLPLQDRKFLTSSRDEITSRGKVKWPVEQAFPGYKIIFPKDIQGKGTWIAADDRQNAVCLINGAFQPHISSGNYRHSRGLVVLDIFSYPSVEEFSEMYDLDNIEPFTLIFLGKTVLIEFIWDGQKKYLKYLPSGQPAIWSSVTLYNTEARLKRKTWFREWLDSTGEINPEKILLFHHSRNESDPENSILMQRKEVQTISITSVEINTQGASMNYDDIPGELRSGASVSFKQYI